MSRLLAPRTQFGARWLTVDDTAALERIIRAGIATHDAVLAFTLIEGTERWVVEWVLLGRLGPIRIITAWDRPRSEDRARLVSCYLKKVKR